MHLMTFDGKSNRDFIVTVSGEDTWRKPAPIMERVSVPGRNGDLVIFTGAYENVSISYHCGITRDFNINYSAFVNYLLSKQGYRKLEDSYHPDLYRMAILENVGDPALKKLYRAGEFDITFLCKPQMFLKSGDNKRTFTSNGTIFNPTLYASKPLLRVYGTGQFSIGNDTVTITSANSYTDLDCETENAYKDNSSNNCNGNVRLSGDSFPTIPAGSNGVTLGSGITRIEIIPRWWQL